MFADKIFANQSLTREELHKVLNDDNLNYLDLAQDAFKIRDKHFGHKVKVHILNNVQNGLCPEDCGYCGQAKTSESGVTPYALKPTESILNDAQKAASSGAFRYCMVLSGRGPSDRAIDHMCESIRQVKEKTGLRTCLSAGLMTKEQVAKLKEAGLDRLNHNLNTSENFYKDICSTHTWQDRMTTLKEARSAGLQLCSGYIFGMGESEEDRLDMLEAIHELKPESIPINFLLPIEGNQVNQPKNLSPEICLRILCAVRYVAPTSEVRIGAGREHHLRSLQPFALYPANSLFVDGYLLTQGDTPDQTTQMIQDAGFEVECESPLAFQEKASFAPLKNLHTHLKANIST